MMVHPILFTIVTAAISLFFSTPVQGECPSGWQRFNDSCYNFVKREMSWARAQADCIRHGSRLVKVTTQEENDFIRNYLNNNGRFFYGYDMWMGGRKDSRGNWDWADGSSLVPDDFSDWRGDAPTDAQPNLCLEFEADFGYHWNQDYCDELSYSICERPFEPLTPPPPTTPTNSGAAVTEDIVG